MAYRFLLEVPESLQEDANVVVNAVDDAQVLVIRNSHGLGFDDPYVDLTVAAHSLRVVDAVYAWYADLGADAPESRIAMGIVLHSGQRLMVGDLSRAQMVAAIRRDQPWVERSIPKIGEHETKHSPGSSLIESEVVPDVEEETAFNATSAVATRTAPVAILAADEAKAAEGITVAGVPHALLKVYDIAKPERVYNELFGTELVGRGNRKRGGGWTFLPPLYDEETEAQDGVEPDYAFLQNGPLTIALEREGRGYPLDYINVPTPIRLTVDMPSLNRIRAQVLMRSYTVLDDTRPDAFAFRDPFGYTWALAALPGEGR
jgi:hypothetical protein